MANPAVTYTFTNGTSADAGQVNTNFTDLINSLTDGTKSLSIDALTVAGTGTFNGNNTFGNASSDDVTFTGSLASSIPVKTNATYNFGSSTLGLLSVYLGNNSQTVRITGSSSMSATYTFTYPVNAGTKGYGLLNGGSAIMSWTPMQTDIHSVSSADYTVLDDDGYAHVHVTTGSTTRTITLPTAADNTDRKITIRKVDSGTGFVTVDGESSETINGKANYQLFGQYDHVTLLCDGTGWHVVNASHHWVATASAQYGEVSWSAEQTYWKRDGNDMLIISRGVYTSSVGTNLWNFTLPNSHTMPSWVVTNGDGANASGPCVGRGFSLDGPGTARGDLFIQAATNSTFSFKNETTLTSIRSNIPWTWAAGDVISWQARVPIDEWA